MDRGAWQAPIHGVTKSLTGLNDSHTNTHQGIWHSMYGKMQASGLTEFIPFPVHLVSLGPTVFPCLLCFLRSPVSSAVTVVGGSIPWIVVLGALVHIWRPGSADGRDISCLLIWQEIFPFTGQMQLVFTQQSPSWFPARLVGALTSSG